MLVLTDDDLDALIDMPAIVAAVRRAIVDHGAGRHHAPPRIPVELGQHQLILTAGGSPDQLGFRASVRPAGAPELVAVWDPQRDELRVLIVGRRLSGLRTGAIGAVAAQVMARPDAEVLASIGSGTQAKAQLMAISATRPLREVLVYSPTPSHRQATARWATSQLGLKARAAADARTAVEAADIVVCATTAEDAVIDARWVRPGTHITTLRPRSAGHSELPPELFDIAAMIATDASEQETEAGRRHPLYGHRAWGRIEPLGRLADRGTPARGAEDITVFLSAGLAGTEVVVASLLAERAQASATGRP